MSETYVTYLVWDGCRAPGNLEYNGKLCGQRVRAVSFDRDALLELADSLDEARGGEDGCGRFLGLGSCRPGACRAAYGDVDCVDTVAQAVASRIRELCGCSV